MQLRLKSEIATHTPQWILLKIQTLYIYIDVHQLSGKIIRIELKITYKEKWTIRWLAIKIKLLSHTLDRQ